MIDLVKRILPIGALVASLALVLGSVAVLRAGQDNRETARHERDQARSELIEQRGGTRRADLSIRRYLQRHRAMDQHSALASATARDMAMLLSELMEAEQRFQGSGEASDIVLLGQAASEIRTINDRYAAVIDALFQQVETLQSDPAQSVLA
jgi:hypothetical protein